MRNFHLYLSMLIGGVASASSQPSDVDPFKIMCQEPVILSITPDSNTTPVYVRSLPSSNAARSKNVPANPNRVVIMFPELQISNTLDSRAARGALAELSARMLKTTSTISSVSNAAFGEGFTLEWPVNIGEHLMVLMGTYKIENQSNHKAILIQLSWKVRGIMAQPMPIPQIRNGESLILELSDQELKSQVISNQDIQSVEKQRASVNVWSSIPGEIIKDFLTAKKHLKKEGIWARLGKRVLLPIAAGVIGASAVLSFLHRNEETTPTEFNRLTLAQISKQNAELKDQLQRYSELVVKSQGKNRILRVEFSTDGKILFYSDDPNLKNFSLEDVVELRTKDGRVFNLDP